jgi:DNA-binding transcriptional regulator YhcF (GntR family)
MPRRATLIEHRIRLSRRVQMAVYLQLADQLRYLIGASEFGVGTRLPPARQLAQNLSINRNTVLSAYAKLAEDGLIETRRGGGTVVLARSPQPGGTPGPHTNPELLDAVDMLIQRARSLRLGPDELSALVSSRVNLDQRPAPRVAFIECNPQSLEHLGGSIEREIGAAVVPVLLNDLPSLAQNGRLDDVDCVVSTFFHFSEVRRALRHRDKELFAIGVRPHLSVLDELASLRRGSVVAVAYFGEREDSFAAARLRRMTEAIEQAHIRGLRVRSLLLDRTAERTAFAGLDALVVRPENIAAVAAKIPSSIRVIEFRNDLDPASGRFLREVFDDLRARSWSRVPPRTE